jgi:cyclomaltodextrinase
VPDWLAQSVIYEINTATFSAAGDFASVTARLPDLQSLGVNLLWLMPIHPAGKLKSKPPHGSPYAVRDYYGINPAYVTAADLHALIQGAHARGMHVIIDIVANHTAWDSVLMQHPDFYKQDAQGQIVPPNKDWTDVAALDYSNPSVRTYMAAMLEHWLRDFDLDGFRCDVAGLVPVDFWEEARQRLEKIKPDVVMLAEWDQPELLRRAFDIDYSWPLYKTLKSVMSGGAPASDVRRTWEEQNAKFQPRALHMRFSDNHDEDRATALFGDCGALAASVLMFTLDGVPLLYNGMEIGDSTESGGDALFYQLKIFWPGASRRPRFLPFYQNLIALRRASKALQSGTVNWIDNSETDSVLTFERRLNDERMLIAINLSNRPVHFAFPGEHGQYQGIESNTFAARNVSLGAWEHALWRHV